MKKKGQFYRRQPGMKATITTTNTVLMFFTLSFWYKITPPDMKKVLIPVLFLATIVVFEFCSGSKKAQKAASAPAVTYANHVQNVVASSCSPCHVGAGAKQKKLDTYDAVKGNIDDIARRIQLNPTDKGFMPFKHPKLPDSTIQVFVAWRAAGTPQ
jgi:hypothetical protein